MSQHFKKERAIWYFHIKVLRFSYEYEITFISLIRFELLERLKYGCELFCTDLRTLEEKV